MESNTVRTRRMYNKFGQEYVRSLDQGRFYNQYIEIPAVRKALGNVRNKKALDCGCAGGTHSAMLVKAGAKVTGLDISPKMVSIAQQRVKGARFCVGDMKKLPFKKASFDIVFYGLCLHYVQDIVPVYREAYRVLKGKGRIIISTHHPVPGSLKRVIVKGKKTHIFNNYFHNDLQEWEMVPGMRIRTYNRTFSDLINPLIRTGFTIKKIVEPRPVAAARKASAKEYENMLKRPLFIVIEAVKP